MEGGVSGIGSKASASMSLYHNSNYTEPYPAGQRVTLPLGSALHVGVSVNETETERFVVVLDNCYTTHSSNPDDPMRYFIIQNKYLCFFIVYRLNKASQFRKSVKNK